MNNLDKQYTDLLQNILDNGVIKKDRTGTGTKSIFGHTIRHDMKEGFPLLTTKKMYFKGIATELIWFLRGDTNIKYLIDNNCHIWNGDAYKKYLKLFPVTTPEMLMDMHRSGNSQLVNDLLNNIEAPLTIEEFISKVKTDDDFAKKWGDLGPVYGKQWRKWESICIDIQNMSEDRKSWSGECCNKEPIDQIGNLISDLKTNPDSRRLIVNAWNVSEIDQMTLPPCHYGFQIYTKELSHDERFGIQMIKNYNQSYYTKEELDINNIPTRSISLIWNQRSVDTFLGLPFNIASYGLLLEILGKIVNMVPDQLIGNLGDTHLYLNHLEQAKEQIGRKLTLAERIDISSNSEHFDPSDFGVGDQVTEEHCHYVCNMYDTPISNREPFKLPTLIHGKTDSFFRNLSEDLSLFDHLETLDFSLENYKSHPAIKGDLSN